MKENNLKQVIIRIPKNDWELFKKITRMEGSNASIEIRRFVKQYLSDKSDKNSELLKKLILKGSNNDK